MLFAALLLLTPIPLIGDLALPVSNPASILALNATNSSALQPAETLIIPEISSPVAPAAPSAPSMPQPKLLREKSWRNLLPPNRPLSNRARWLSSQ